MMVLNGRERQIMLLKINDRRERENYGNKKRAACQRRPGSAPRVGLRLHGAAGPATTPAGAEPEARSPPPGRDLLRGGSPPGRSVFRSNFEFYFRGLPVSPGRSNSSLAGNWIVGYELAITGFLGVHLAENLTCSLNTSSIAKKAQQHLYFLQRLRKVHLLPPTPILITFYRGCIESILSSCITAWFRNCTISDRKTLQEIVRSAEKIIGVSLPAVTDTYITRCICKANSNMKDPMHPLYKLFSVLPSGKRHRSIWALMTRLCNSFFSQAIGLLNTQSLD
ncbi:uncharacterized protein LOC132395444 isoform X2 [Hypanus sabinus]|uniref:uncharacterized protein LOC132395444 isoform X2 n=1 Tax=Hypanus sabinus TaxID=79690 RepID=UPI0028C492D4|nr:uncharacterized protein LOC132395444 isoform X2 [Hypanus sabinus]